MLDYVEHCHLFLDDVKYYLDNKSRPLKYRRDYDLEKGEIKKELKQKVITSIKKDTTNREVKYQPSL